ncbi:MAG: hypothetical protein GWN58_48170 [Anaerolineae bacterium]|nr:hypothetical protein [Anaerolineae bacterium]
MSVREAKTRLFHRGNDLVAWVYRRIVEQCRERGILPVHILYPLVEREDPGQLADHRRMALEAGFVLLDLSDVFDGEDLDSLRLAEWDDHMGARAHRLVADRIYQELTNRQVLAQLARTNSTTKEIHGRHQSAD